MREIYSCQDWKAKARLRKIIILKKIFDRCYWTVSRRVPLIQNLDCFTLYSLFCLIYKYGQAF